MISQAPPASVPVPPAAPAERLHFPVRRLGRFRGSAAMRAVALALAVGSIGMLAVAAIPSRRQPASPPPMSNSELEVTLLRSGISPDALAAAGFTGEDTAALVGRARYELSEVIVQFRAADAALAGARGQLDGLERKVRSGLGDERDVTALAAARTAFAAAEAGQQSELNAVRAAALGDGQAPSRVGTLETIRSNSRWRFPAQYLCKAATEAEWVALRNALSIKRQAEAASEELPPATQQLLSVWNADTAVSTATSNLSIHLVEVKAAWARAIAGIP